jgi:hypothetical protein
MGMSASRDSQHRVHGSPNWWCASSYDGLVRPITGFSGSLLVTCDGVTLLRASAGEADASAGKACSAETRFQIASVSKQLTAATVRRPGGGSNVTGCCRPI